ncbi:alkaline phosphatase family protein [Labrenzia polysiphoniae]|uniref:Alkaline phosphatase family protein n=1 Tax=Roseibium polysiphoniae TaxID=2571221 RepID=A0ABR9CC73_9HYPH|nr:alkaline phosphatase family protein [Roseibium polysiphoniae]MBD8877494.1 alkaline phosphatase family protein [Roseibium polysiphoniae]
MKPEWIKLGVTAAISVLPFQSAAASEPLKLVLQVTVDQLRGDLIDRNLEHFGDNGFRYLLQNGVYYTDAHHRHANTETIVGHATLATGTDPAVHGMVANLWFDRASGKPFYNVQDPDYPLLAKSGVDQSTEIDPTQRAATSDGRSPSSILSSTLSDEIAVANAGASKVFGVSVKDRGAISMAGHSGTAYWFSKSEGRFVTSSYYMDAYPDWVSNWNDAGHVGAYAYTDWKLSDSENSYRFIEFDDAEWETDFPGFGRTFPHPFGASDSKYYTTFLTLSPAGDELTASFAKTLIDNEAIGEDGVTDYLSVSFSSTDYVGHIFGPSSLEAEDNLRRLDQTIGQLLDHVDEKVGLENTLVVLSADHGAAEVPGYLEHLGIPAGFFSFNDVDKEPAAEALIAEFGAAQDLIASFSQPYVYLNDKFIAENGLKKADVAKSLARELQKIPAIAHAFSSEDLAASAIARTPVSDAVLANFHPSRSGDIYVVFEPHWFVGDFDGLHVASHHGSPWSYDTHVPIIFSRPGMAAQRVSSRVETVDVAPTVSAYLKIKAPSGARGRVLKEALATQ